jgi:arginine decarboxylase
MTSTKGADASLSDYYSAVQLRQDRWSTLRELCETLVRLNSEKPSKATAPLAKAKALLDSLAPIEMYWAFPGRAAFEHLRRMLETRSFDDLAFATRRIARALTSGTYRRRAVPLARDSGDHDDSDDDLHTSIESRAMQKPYFEILIVDQVTEYQERFQKQSLQRIRREEDGFIYEAVITPSFEDALIAILFNHNIQAVIVRPGLTLKSENKLPILQRYLTRLEDEDVDELAPQDYGPELCRQIAKIRPELDTYLITDRSVEDVAGLDLGLCKRVFYNQEDFLELHLNILRGVGARYKTPFFSALVEYSKQPTGVFHAMPISRGKSITRSH